MNDDLKILKARAKEVSGRKTKPEMPGESVMVVEFLLTSERYGIDTQYVSEVLSLKEMTLIPGVPAFVTGIMNVRGKILSIVNLKLLFNLKEKGLTELNKIIILKCDKMEFGIVVDAIAATREVFIHNLGVPPANIDGTGAEYIKGITPDGLILLDGEHILSNKAIIVNQK
ncbi:MAG: chemotaxis protein CheW [Bacteroidota bacterium]